MNALSEKLLSLLNENIDTFEDLFKSYLASQGLQYYTQAYKLNLIGIRGENDHSNLFDDSLTVMYYDESGSLHVHIFDITTHPGIYYTLNPIPGTNGAGILVEGQYVNGFMRGSHTSHVAGVEDTYPCLTQAIELPVYRDNVKDGKLYFDPATIQKAFIGLQIHRALKDQLTTVVFNWSAACQVHSDGPRYSNEFWPLCEQHFSKACPFIGYTLIKEAGLFPVNA